MIFNEEVSMSFDPKIASVHSLATSGSSSSLTEFEQRLNALKDGDTSRKTAALAKKSLETNSSSATLLNGRLNNLHN